MDEPLSGAFSQPSSHPRYALQELLGQGGMGLVWRAFDTRLKRFVALKHLPDGASEDQRKRFDREARVAARLSHRGIVAVFDEGQLEDGRSFFTMELLQIPVLDGGSHDIERLVAIARAVGFAHAQGMVHRDLKPGNLGLRADGEPVVLDWGLAKPMDEAEGWSQRVLSGTIALTQTGTGVGTLGYVAPEQLSGAPAHPTADVWSLGVMLAGILTGAPAGQVVASLSTHGLPDTAIGRVAKRALALEPSERFADANVLADALDAARVPARWSWIGAIGLGAVGVVAGLGAWLSSATPASLPLEAYAALLVEQGRFLEAVEHLEEAPDTPVVRGIRAIPRAAAPTTSPDPCIERRLGTDTWLCLTAGTVQLRRGSQTAWTRPRPDFVNLAGDVAAMTSGAVERFIDVDGVELGHRPSLHPSAAMAWSDGALYAVSGDRIERFEPDEDGLLSRVGSHQMPVRVTPQLGVACPGGVTAVTDGTLVAVTDRIASLVRFDEPMVRASRVGDRLVHVGLRGLVVVLDAETLAERERYRLQGVRQIEAVDVGSERRLVAATPHGVFLFRGSRVVHQLSRQGGRVQLDDGGVSVLADGTERRWVPPRWTLSPSEASVTAFASQEPLVAVGTSTYLFRPDDLLFKESRRVDAGPVRSVVFGPLGVSGPDGFLESDDGTRTSIGMPVMAQLPDHTVFASARFRPDVAIIVDGAVERFRAPVSIRTLVPDADGEGVLGIGADGGVYRIDRRRTIERLAVEGVGVVAAGASGRAFAMGDRVQFAGWERRLSSPVTALLVLDAHLVVGCRNGDVVVFDASGDRVAEIGVHGERVSALGTFGNRLFTGSWEPGVRAYALESLTRD